jgi:hypothetical protein
VFLRLVGETEGGRWRCLLCGAEVRREAFLGVPWWTAEVCRGGRRERLQAWTRQILVVEHEHGWARDGCHFTARGILCFRLTALSALETLRDHPDRAFAGERHRELVATPTGERLELLRRWRQTAITEARAGAGGPLPR